MRSLRCVWVVGAICATDDSALAQSVARQAVRFEVQARNQVSFGAPAPLDGRAAGATRSPGAAWFRSSYALGVADDNLKLTAQVDSLGAGGGVVSVHLAPPAGARGAGEVVLSREARDVVTGIDAASESGLDALYRLSGPDARGARPGARRIIFTVTEGS